MLLFYLLYAASNPIDRICNKEAFYSANTTMTSEQSKQYRLINGKLLCSCDFHIETNQQIMFAILCKNPNIANILIITRECQLFRSGRIRKSPLHNIEHTMPPPTPKAHFTPVAGVKELQKYLFQFKFHI